ncbi:MAG: hypothetical protein JNM68_05560, partial [Dinghuibacter sp.]|nr:hypothetical protein [Dinghuibacter sp.]
VDFYCKTNEPNLRSPNNGCLEEQQDALPVKMVITSTDGTVTMEIENTYGNFLAGFWRSVQLPLNKTYRVKFVYNYSVPCEYQFPFTAHIQGKYYIPLQDKQAGGLRIKKILNYDGLGGVLTKEYDYNKPDGHSSATLHRLPNFDYTKSSESFVVTWGYGYKHFYNRYFKRTSSPNQSLEYLSGSPLLYTKVTEKISGHGVIEREFNDLGATYLGTGLYPFQPTPDLSFASSLPTREAVKDAGGNLKTEKLFTYNTIINSIPVTGNTNLKTGVVGSSPTGSPVIVVSTYIPQTGRAELIQTVNKQYENGTVLTTTENNTYDGSRYYLKSSQTKNSKQEEIITYFDYPADFNGTAPYSDMVLKNMIAAPVQQTQHNMATPLASEMVRVKTNYQTWNGNTFIGASTIQQSISGGPAKTVFTTNKYDAKGNILQTTDKTGIVTSYIWGYNGMYPVAQITGADHNTVIAFVNQALINNPNTTDQQMRDELNLIRTGLAGTKAQVTTFTHEPLIGITSQTDANNRTVFYEYDGHNRLTLLRN